MSYVPIYRVLNGSRLVLDGCDWLVTGVGENAYAVEGVDDGECRSFSFQHIDQAIKDRDCEVVAPKDIEKRDALLRFTGGLEVFEQLSHEQQRDIRYRLAIVLAIDALEAEGEKVTQRSINTGGPLREKLLLKASKIHGSHKFSDPTRKGRVELVFLVPEGRTLKKYHSTYHEFGDKPIVLMEREHMKGNRSRRLSPLKENFIDHVLASRKDPRQVKLAPLLKLAYATFHVPPKEIAAGFKFPSKTTIRARMKAVKKFVEVGGRNGWQYARNRIGAGTSDIRAQYYGEKGQVDQVYLSLFTDTGGTVRAKRIDPEKVPHELEENEICRLWLHLMIDVATRLPLAWIIAKSADADHTEALMRMATRDKTREKIRYGCIKDPAPPVGIMSFEADNGGATRNGPVYGAQLGVGMTVIPARSYHSIDKPHVERIFGTSQWAVLNFLPGYTGSRPGELTDYDPKKSVAITHNEFYGQITRYFVDEYSHEQHLGVGMYGATPWEKMLDITKNYRKVDPPTQRERCLHLGVKVNATTTSNGVKAFNIPFNSTELMNFTGGASRKVTVHLDPDDLRHAYVTVKGSTDIIKVNLTMTVFADLTLEEAIELMEEACRRDPKAQELHDDHLQEVRRRRAQESHFFPNAVSPPSYQNMHDLNRRGSRLAQVPTRPKGVTGPTARAGSLTDRTGVTPAFKVGERSVASNAKPPPKSQTSLPTGKTFTPIKDSKL
ncbi:Mu transposase C-terminal domain-containing protein [Tabrizicola soli]|uniref:Mu transposase C-terminal domain-containing protein n=1 Tax=Tabrizicola soli TaxID=2185115 RepID=A0ABV7DNF9_9RHOB|nr:Mu transposase C-terminal domain-containing protein [Tabrizicola soli]